jgi:uncharacterized protein (DUF58 family)
MTPGRVLVFLLIVGGLLGSLISGSAFYSRLLYLGLLLFIGAWLWTWLVARSLHVERKADARRGRVGDIFKEHFDVFNRSGLLALWVEVHNAMPLPAATGSRFLTMIRAHQKQSYVARMWLTKRGGFPLGPTVLTVSDPFGIFRVEKQFPPAHSLIVLPMIFPIKTFLAPPGLLPGGQVIRRKSLDITPHASGVREYVAGDPLKQIHWATSARRGRLMVKEFDQDPQAEVWLFLDAQKNVQAAVAQNDAPLDAPIESLLFSRKPKFTLPASTLEYGISIAASLAHYFIGQKRAVGFVAADRAYTMIPAERSERQESKIFETLAFLEGGGNLSIAALIGAQARQLPTGSSVILITPIVQPQLLIAVDVLQRRNLHPVVILLSANSFGGAPGSEALARQLKEGRVQVCLVRSGDDLSQALANFSSNYQTQDLPAWQRPALSHLI